MIQKYIKLINLKQKKLKFEEIIHQCTKHQIAL
jgi:hypothetical protein